VYVTLDMTGRVDALVEHALGYVEELAAGDGR
jgi:hypothetical protein